MEIKICIIDGCVDRTSKLKFICERVGQAINEQIEFVAINENEIKSLVNDQFCIIIIFDDNPWISIDDFVNIVISDGGSAVIIALAKEQRIRFRYLPAHPFALVDTTHYEELIAIKVKEAITKIQDYK